MSNTLIVLRLLLAVICLSLCLFASNAKADNAKDMFERPLKEVQACAKSHKNCKKCYRKCPSKRKSFFNVQNDKFKQWPKKVLKCRKSISKARKGIQPWCLSDDKRFYASSGFLPNHQTCAHLDPDICGEQLAEELKRQAQDGKIPFEHIEQILEAATAYKYMEIQRVKYEAESKKFTYLKRLYSPEMLKEMNDHLRNPQETHTRFNDPVYKEIANGKAELKRLETKFADNDVKLVKEQTQKVRHWTENLIDERMHLMDIYQNQLQSESQNAEVTGYMNEIRGLIRMIYQSQLEARDYQYESKRDLTIQGELNSLDKQYTQQKVLLGAARDMMRTELKKAAKQKQKLVNSIRLMIKTISFIQKKNCPGDDHF